MVAGISPSPKLRTLTLASPCGKGAGGGEFQFFPLGGEADFGETEEDQAENRLGVFGLFEPRPGPELVCRVPEAFFQYCVVGVFL